jgi:type VI secretion system protein ImpC
MPSESTGPRYDGARGSIPSDRLTLEVQTQGANRVIPSTLVVGVLADLSGQPEPALPELSRRAFIEIDRDNFDDVLAKSRLRLAYQVEDLARGDGSLIDVVLRFNRLDDFEPEPVVRQLESLRPLIEARGRLADLEKSGSRDQVAAVLQELRDKIGVGTALDPGPSGSEPAQAERPVHRPEQGQGPGDASILEQVLGLQAGALPRAPEEEARGSTGRLLDEYLAQAMAGVRTVSRDTREMISDGVARIDDLLGKQLSRVLQHPSFQRLEAAWRGLHDLVFNSETGGTLQIRALNIGKPELLHDLERAGSFHQTELFRKLDRAAERGEPFGVLLGDYDFSRQSADLAALETLARVAAAAHAPFLAAVAIEFFGLTDFAELDDLPELIGRLEAVEYDRWREFRAADPSRYVGLCLPPILSRLPYGRETRSVELFAFEEDFRAAGRRAYLWGNAVFSLGRRLTDAFANDGSCDRIQGIETGGKVRRLPVHIVRIEDEPVITGPCAIALSQRRASELARLGFIPLVSIRNTDEAAFLAVVSCHQPQELIRIEVGSG